MEARHPGTRPLLSFDGYDLMDDDQTLLLMAYRNAPSLFETHFVDAANAGWFVLFKDYNMPQPRQD